MNRVSFIILEQTAMQQKIVLPRPAFQVEHAQIELVSITDYSTTGSITYLLCDELNRSSGNKEANGVFQLPVNVVWCQPNPLPDFHDQLPPVSFYCPAERIESFNFYLRSDGTMTFGPTFRAVWRVLLSHC